MLRTSEKEQAENVMIVDMVRHDLGRVADTGTISRALLVCGGEIPDRMANDLHHRGQNPPPLSAASFRALPAGLGHRRAEGKDNGNHRPA